MLGRRVKAAPTAVRASAVPGPAAAGPRIPLETQGETDTRWMRPSGGGPGPPRLRPGRAFTCGLPRDGARCRVSIGRQSRSVLCASRVPSLKAVGAARPSAALQPLRPALASSATRAGHILSVGRPSLSPARGLRPQLASSLAAPWSSLALRVAARLRARPPPWVDSPSPYRPRHRLSTHPRPPARASLPEPH